jgi:hypothetical protein
MSWDGRTSGTPRQRVLGAELFARRKAGSGQALASLRLWNWRTWCRARLTRQSAEVILTALIAEEGIAGIDPAARRLIDRALNRAPGLRPFRLWP